MSGETETLLVELPAEVAQSVRSAVESGRYESVSHMVWAALDYLGEAEAAEPTSRRLDGWFAKASIAGRPSTEMRSLPSCGKST
jgi:Arc/MetJ-type ribon-helix-helix transcriptional regulator